MNNEKMAFCQKLVNDGVAFWKFLTLSSKKKNQELREKLFNTPYCAFYYAGFPVKYLTKTNIDLYMVLVKKRQRKTMVKK